MTTTAMPSAPPTPDLTWRDSMGRLVAVIWHGPGANSDPDGTVVTLTN